MSFTVLTESRWSGLPGCSLRIEGSMIFCILFTNAAVTERDMTPERIRAVYDICHAYEIKTTVKNMAFVMVIEPDGTISQKVQYSADGVIVYLYNKDARIVWESKDGRHYIDSIPYETMRMFYENRYMEICKNIRKSMRKRNGRKRKKN